MMILCVIALTAAQPGITLGHARWKEGAMKHPFWRSQKSHEQQGRTVLGSEASEVPVGTAVTTEENELEKTPTVADNEASSVSGQGSDDGMVRKVDEEEEGKETMSKVETKERYA